MIPVRSIRQCPTYTHIWYTHTRNHIFVSAVISRPHAHTHAPVDCRDNSGSTRRVLQVLAGNQDDQARLRRLLEQARHNPVISERLCGKTLMIHSK